MEESPPPRRSSLGFAFLAILAVGGSAAGVMVYQYMQGRQNPPPADNTGFDIAEVSEKPRQVAASAGAPASLAQSSLGMVKTGMQGLQFGARVTQSAIQRAESTFAELVRQGEAKIQSMAERYTKQHPVIGQYGKEWMSYPDLKKLNDDYMRDHDPGKYLRGLAASKNFGAMVKKYAPQGPVQGFVKEALKVAPPGAMDAAMSFLNEDKVIKQMVDNVAGALGLPPGLLGSVDTNGAEPKVDQQAVMGSLMNNNPEMKKAMENQEVQKSLNSPETQRKLRNPTQ